MPAPKGNRFWEARSKHGREKAFKCPEDLWKSCVEYFEWVDANPLEEAIIYQGELNKDDVKPLMRAMTMEGLFLFLSIDDETWRNYRQAQGYEEYFGIVKKVEYVIRTQKFTGAAAGLLNPNIIARDLGLSEKQETTHSGSVSYSDLTEEQLDNKLKALLDATTANDKTAKD